MDGRHVAEPAARVVGATASLGDQGAGVHVLTVLRGELPDVAVQEGDRVALIIAEGIGNQHRRRCKFASVDLS